jgi:hypothetical protein
MSYQIESNEGMGDALRRIAIELIDDAIARTEAPGADRQEVVREVRRACKKWRGLLRLVRPAPKLYATENARIRDAEHDVGADADAGVDATRLLEGAKCLQMSQVCLHRCRCRNRLSDHDDDNDDRCRACQRGRSRLAGLRRSLASEKPKALRERLRGYCAAMRQQQQGISERASA